MLLWGDSCSCRRGAAPLCSGRSGHPTAAAASTPAPPVLGRRWTPMVMQDAYANRDAQLVVNPLPFSPSAKCADLPPGASTL